MREDVSTGLQTALRTKGLNLHYGLFHALKGVDFQVYKNSITSLIGPSGCGKSTLLRCFNRMNDLVDGVTIEGDITIDDASIETMDIIDLRRRVGMVFQRPNPFPFSVCENMVYGLAVHGIRKKRHEVVERCLQAVGLWDDLKDSMKQPALLLSEETKQRLCIARLLTIEPEIILLDEPCSALDPIATMRVEELMDRAEEGLYDPHSDAQHAAGSTRLRLYGLHAAGRAAGIRKNSRRLYLAQA